MCFINIYQFLDKRVACIIIVEDFVGIIRNKNFSLKAISFRIKLKSITNIKIKENFEFRNNVNTK